MLATCARRKVRMIDATQRKLIVGIVIATLIALAGVIADLASGGRPDPPTLRAAATLLDGCLAIPYRR